MHAFPLRRLPLLAAALLTLLLVVPAAARADDRAFAREAITQAVTVDRYETAASTALGAIDTRGERAIPGARRAIKLVRRQVDRFLAAVRPQQTSTAEGAAAKRKLFELFDREKRAYGTVDTALVAFLDGDYRRARTLLGRAKTAIASVRREAARLGVTLQRMAAEQAPAA